MPAPVAPPPAAVWLGLVATAAVIACLIYRTHVRRTEMEQTARVAIAGGTRFRALLEAAPDATITVAEDGRITLVNSQTETLFGYSRTELIGQPIEILMPDELRAAHVAHRRDFCAQPRRRPMGAYRSRAAPRGGLTRSARPPRARRR